MIRAVASRILLIAVTAGCETSATGLIGFPGEGGGVITQAQASGTWSFTLRKTTTFACTGGSFADGQVLVTLLNVQSDGSVTGATSSWQNPATGGLLPASGRVTLSDGITDLFLTSSSGTNGMELRGTLTSAGAFTGTLTDPAPSLGPMFSTGGCEYTAAGLKS